MSPEVADIKKALEDARTEGLAAIKEASDGSALEAARVKVLGRKAPLSRARSGLRSVAGDRVKELGMLANAVQAEIEQAFATKAEVFARGEREKRWERERLDVTLPGATPPLAAGHPLTKTIDEIVDVFIGLGYRLAEGPEVELSSLNFDALNQPIEHPSRSPRDTYFVAGRDDVVLRPHTSPVQIRAMEAQQPPIYVLAPGRCYRRDELDPTHLNQFAQIEGLAVDEGITMADLKGTLEVLAHELFGHDLEVRLRPHYFPFTEPSAELDVECFVCRGAGCRVCKQEGWIELLGCGMVHPAVLEWVGYDPERYSGFAFGMGVERAAALAHGVSDIRYFYENDLRFLSYFQRSL